MTLLRESKYAEARAAHPGLRELNALEAVPQGQGIGTQLIWAAEQAAQGAGGSHLGLAVEPDNRRARALYGRLGYADWGRGRVVDAWDEYDELGGLVRHHADPCDYLLARLTPSTPHAGGA